MRTSPSYIRLDVEVLQELDDLLLCDPKTTMSKLILEALKPQNKIRSSSWIKISLPVHGLAQLELLKIEFQAESLDEVIALLIKNHILRNNQ